MELRPLLNNFKPDTDNYLVMTVLVDGAWHNVIEIMRLKDNPQTGFVCRNWAIRSRISDIKKVIICYGFTIDSLLDDNGCSKYRITENQMSLAI